MKKVVFLDRDGVINYDRKDYTWKLEDFELLPGVLDGCKSLTKAGFDLVVITNQGGIAKGLYRHEDVNSLHDHMNRLFMMSSVALLDIYYCPHHPDYGKCLCRKPGSLLIEKAIARFQIDASVSYFIGDMDRDTIAATQAGVKAIKVDTNDHFLQHIKTIL
jgi:D-glycero-D-manno-heptose 1,7-bisphosphate phosphatase